MEWQHKIKKDILTGLYGNQPRWFLPSNAFSSSSPRTVSGMQYAFSDYSGLCLRSVTARTAEQRHVACVWLCHLLVKLL